MSLSLITFGVSSDRLSLATAGLASALEIQIGQLTALIKRVELTIADASVVAAVAPNHDVLISLEQARAIASITPATLINFTIEQAHVNANIAPNASLQVVIDSSRAIALLCRQVELVLAIDAASASGQVEAAKIDLSIDAATLNL